MDPCARHSGAGRNPVLISTSQNWIPAFAGMTSMDPSEHGPLRSSFRRRPESSSYINKPELDPSLRWDDEHGPLRAWTPALVIPAQAGIQFLYQQARTGSQPSLG